MAADKNRKDLINKAHELRAKGMPVVDIAEALEVHRATVYDYLRGMPTKTAKDGKPELKASIVAYLKRTKNEVSVEALSDRFDAGISKVKAALSQLADEGFNLTVRGEVASLEPLLAPSEPTLIDISKFRGKRFTVGVTGDNHYCSKYAREDVLEALFDIWADQGVTDVYQCGNMIDGEARFNKFDLKVHGMQAQVDYFVEKWPKRKGITTRFITGDDHEGWYVQREGVDIGKFMQLAAEKAGRKDLKYLGHMEHDIAFQGKKDRPLIRLIHAGGGTAYALSYQPQSIINSYQGGEKPSILFIGHYHKAEFNYWREILNLQVGCTEDQTPFMRKRNIQAHVGGWTVSFEVDDNGVVHNFAPAWHPFFDRDFYTKWRYTY